MSGGSWADLSGWRGGVEGGCHGVYVIGVVGRVSGGGSWAYKTGRQGGVEEVRHGVYLSCGGDHLQSFQTGSHNHIYVSPCAVTIDLVGVGGRDQASGVIDMHHMNLGYCSWRWFY